jgi:Fic family protein
VDRDRWTRVAARLALRRAEASTAQWQRVRRIIIQSGVANPNIIASDAKLSPTQASWVQVLLTKGHEGVRAVVDGELRTHALAEEAARSGEALTSEWVRQLHAELASGQETYIVTNEKSEILELPIPKGTYKVYRNHGVMTDGTAYCYAPIDQTAAEVDRFVQEMNTATFAAAHPALQAAYSLHVVSVVHPFADGNGRVSRLLASRYLYGAVGLPIVVTPVGRGPYLRAVEFSEKGEIQKLVDWTYRRALETMHQATDLLSAWALT